MGQLQSLISGISMISSLIGMGTSSVTQVRMAQQTFQPTPSAVVQQCPANTYPSVMTDSQGRQVQICIKDVR